MLQIKRKLPNRASLDHWLNTEVASETATIALSVLHLRDTLRDDGLMDSEDPSLEEDIFYKRPGLHIIFGDTHSGKSSVMTEMIEDAHGVSLTVEEPVDGAFSSYSELLACITGEDGDEDEGVAPVDPMSEVEVSFTGEQVVAKPVFGLDSTKLTQFEVSGNAMTGGMSSGYGRLLNDLAIFALRSKTSIIMVANGLLPSDHAQYDLVMGRIEANVSSLIDGSYRTGWTVKSRVNATRGADTLKDLQADRGPGETDGAPSATVISISGVPKERNNQTVAKHIRKAQVKRQDVTMHTAEGDNPVWHDPSAVNSILDQWADD